MIPFNKPFIAGKELFNISKAVIEHKHLSGDGPYTQECHQWLQEKLRCRQAFLTLSCTAALEMAAILFDIGPGDEVIMPSFTFVSTANAFVLRGGVPVFIDIRPDTLNIDETKVKAAITDRTKAIVPVHYAGYPCEMDAIQTIAQDYNLFVAEDAAQALLSQYNGKSLGTIGDLGCISFHETKNIISGEGGALLVNNPMLTKRAEIIWEKGTDRRKFLRGEVDKYIWVDIGSSFLPSEMVAAFLSAQFEIAETIISTRTKLHDLYTTLLAPLEANGIIKLPYTGTQNRSNGHLFYIIVKSIDERQQLIAHLGQNDIQALFHYVPLHSSPAGRKFGRTSGTLDVTDNLSQRIIRLPLYYEITEDEVKKVVDKINEFYGSSD